MHSFSAVAELLVKYNGYYLYACIYLTYFLFDIRRTNIIGNIYKQMNVLTVSIRGL